MIIEYHRPEKIEEALALLARVEPTTLPLGGGTVLNQPSRESRAVVDLQSLNLNTIEINNQELTLGATVTLQELLEVSDLPLALAKAIRHEAAYNLRHMSTIAGTLVAADGRSPFATAMLALSAQILILGEERGDEQVALGEFYPLRSEKLSHRLITKVTIPKVISLAYHYVARSPADLPIVAVAIAQWPSNRTRVVLGGYGESPLLVLDGLDASGAEIAARSAYSAAGDVWASAEYRSDIAAVLTKRCLNDLN